VLDTHFNRQKPRFVRFGQSLLLEGVPLPNLADSGVIGTRLVERSGLGMVAEGFFQDLATQKVREKADPAEAWKVTELLLRDLARAAREDHATFAVFDATYYDAKANEPLRRLLERQQIRYVDIAPAFTGRFEAYRVPSNLHWNQAGHRVVGDFLTVALGPLLRH
jgi:hypothetical protein